MSFEVEKETDGKINEPQRWGMKPTRQTTVIIDAYLSDQAKRIGLSLKDAMDFGLNFKLAEHGIVDYPNNKLSEKILKINSELSNISQKMYDYEDELRKLKGNKPEVVDKEAEDHIKEITGGKSNE